MTARRFLMALAVTSALGVASVLLAGFVWPERAADDWPASMNLGSIGQYAPGTVTLVEPPADYRDSRWPEVETQIASQYSSPTRMWLVRLPDGAVRLLLARGPHEGCTIPWRETFEFEGQEGRFRNPCHGSTYALDGRWVDGASNRDMDWLGVDVESDGDVVIDLRTLHEGEHHLGVRAEARPRPDIDVWSAAP